MNIKHNPHVAAARAIASTLIDRYLLRFIGSIAAALLCLVLISLLLVVMHSSWWLILTVLSLPLAFITSALAVLIWFIASKIAPRKLLKNEKRQINQFVDDFSLKLVALRAIKRTPAGIASIIAWKWLRGAGDQSITSIITEPLDDAKNLKNKFTEITRLFS